MILDHPFGCFLAYTITILICGWRIGASFSAAQIRRMKARLSLYKMGLGR